MFYQKPQFTINHAFWEFLWYNPQRIYQKGVNGLRADIKMLTGKQKRYLRSLGNELVPIVQLGKGGLGENLHKQVEDVLEARELIKGRVLQNCLEEPKEIAAQLAEEVGAELVQVIGRNFLLYRAAKEKPVIQLP
jgi:RNA-binding protein